MFEVFKLFFPFEMIFNFLIIRYIKNQDTVTKIIDMVPDLIDRFTTKKEEMPSDDDVINTAFPEYDYEE